MADVIKKAQNKFTKGLVMDFSPENTGNEVLTHALNATLLTFNGNELSLQNDMGNGRVETAFLPEGYIPVGTCEYGGIIYIVSYNPLENKSQIGCFPSPERNISSDELGISDKYIRRNTFQEFDGQNPTGVISNTSQCVTLKEDNLNPGDKFIISSESSIYKELLKDLYVKDDNDNFKEVAHPIIALNIVSIEDSGKIVYLDSSIVNYTETAEDDKGVTKTFKYKITGKLKDNASNLESTDIDTYRNVLSSGYSVFKSKTSGKLAILAELIKIDSYSVTYGVEQEKDANGKDIKGNFNVIINTDVSPTLDSTNYLSAPKLRYYYLSKSQGELVCEDGTVIPLFQVDDKNKITQKINTNLLNTTLSTIDHSVQSDKSLKLTGAFNFPKTDSYHGRMVKYEGDGIIADCFTKFSENKLHRIHRNQVYANPNHFMEYYIQSLQARFYVYNEQQQETPVTDYTSVDENGIYYIEQVSNKYIDAKRSDEYKDYTLYKITSIINPLSKNDKNYQSILNDSSIDKYVNVTEIIYRVAQQKDIEDTPDQLYIKIDKEDGSSYVSASYTDPDKTYYVMTSTSYYQKCDNPQEETRQLYYYNNNKLNYQSVAPGSTEHTDYFNKEKFPYIDDEQFCWGYEEILYYLDTTKTTRQATKTEVQECIENKNGLLYIPTYLELQPHEMQNLDTNLYLFIQTPSDVYVSVSEFTPNDDYNDINQLKPLDIYEDTDSLVGPIYLYVPADFIPDDVNYSYNPLRLANIQIPLEFCKDDSIAFPFSYSYTIMPCMNYGKLDYLKFSDTIDFSKISDISKSNINIWKYRIDGNQVRLIFGAQIYDALKPDNEKVDAIVLEFYDAFGFAGSLEINDKKYYSGIYNKLLYLNSNKALGTNKIHNNSYITNYKHRYDIFVDGDTYSYNGEVLQYDQTTGWTNLPDEYNDCGTLYPNILYGVKIFRRTPDTINSSADNQKYNFTKLGDFFLYTLPIYNDYYYSCDNFNELEYPKIDLVLAYKIKDASTSEVYHDDNVSNNGYVADDGVIESYLKGESDQASISTVKYYKYKGTSNVYLELGIKQDYTNYNINCDENIKNYFSCVLKVQSSEPDKAFTVTSDNTSGMLQEQLLEYGNLDLMPKNKFGFLSSYTQDIHVNSNQFKNAAFYKGDGDQPIQVNYDFIVGYKIDITDIKVTEIQTSTACALVHKKDSEYNLSDFDIYYDGTQYKCYNMFYNAGDADNEIFGLCRQKDTNTDSIVGQFQEITSMKTTASDKTQPGSMNSGSPMKEMMTQIGKLSFCLPHVHGLSEDTGVNCGKSSKGSLIVWPDLGDESGTVDNNTRGIAADINMYKQPLCSMGIISKNTAKYYTQFYSTIKHQGTYESGPVLIGAKTEGKVGDENLELMYYNNNDGNINVESNVFTGISSADLVNYNTCLIETMKNVYGYNPDYDYYSFNLGNVNVQDKKIKFVSNLISSNSRISDDKPFNHFILFGAVSVENYLKNLQKHSDIKVYTDDSNSEFIPQISFKPSFKYCGDDKTGVLLTSLNYNIPCPSEIEDELTFNSKNKIVVRTHDGDTETINGVLDKKALYTFDKTNKQLVKLSANNYTINDKGVLTLNDLINTKYYKLQGDTVKHSLWRYCEIGDPVSISYGYGESDAIAKDSKLFFTPEYGYLDTDDTRIIFEQGLHDENNIIVRVESEDPNYSCELTNFKANVKGRAYVVTSNFNVGGWSGQKIMQEVSRNQDSNAGTVTLRLGDIQLNDYTYTICELDKESKLALKVSFSDTPAQDSYIIVKLDIQSLEYTYNINQSSSSQDNIHIGRQTIDKYYTSNGKYNFPSKYNQQALRYTNIIIDDLVYDGTDEQHRLYLKDGNDYYKSDWYIRNRIYYRSLSINEKVNTTNKRYRNKGCDYDVTKNKNALFLFGGPSFDTNIN